MPIPMIARLSGSAFWVLLALSQATAAQPDRRGVVLDDETQRYHVYPGGDIQAALEAAAGSSENRTVTVHAGTYRPDSARQALIWFNRRHDGIRLLAEGEVILTAANPDIAKPADAGYPAVVNHVVYFGDGVTRKTVFDGFRITGANGFLTYGGPNIESSAELRRSLFFYRDGGAIKIFGRSYPTIRNIEVYDNYANPCAGGISIEHGPHPLSRTPVLIENCIMRNNRAEITGAAIDVLPLGHAEIRNCLFVGNVANAGPDWISGAEPYNGKHGSGALTVFETGRATVTNSTFTGNWAGVDDRAERSTYRNNIFWKNNLPGGIAQGARYEMDIVNSDGVTGNFLNGDLEDVQDSIDAARNTLNAPDPLFDVDFVPTAPEYSEVGYRPFALRKDD
ncbi:MAG: right-handed parallel beta-helix repeat-containing protein [Gammaproteobacteria bacterium]|nr:right-handed parallel beta-helix repeat-containing protein [Gammaproteobacteria bacterium]